MNIFLDDSADEVIEQEPFSLETALNHQLKWHPQDVQTLMAGRSNVGSVSCSCGHWNSMALDNRAGQADARADHAQHELRELRATVLKLAEELGYPVD